jgi:hypothetical protein
MAPSESPQAKSPAQHISPAMRIAAIALRTLFIAILLAIAVRVSLPQSETIWSAYETPADLVRFMLGVAMCLWLGFQLLHGPTDAQAHRTWFYLGLAAVPFGAICLYAIW